MKLRVPFFRQDNDHNCGPAALQMAMDFFGVFKSEADLARALKTNHQFGTSHEQLLAAARRAGFHGHAESGASFKTIKRYLRRGLPVIANFKDFIDGEGHYAVVVGWERGEFILHDPWRGAGRRVKEDDFNLSWILVIWRGD